MVRDTICAEAPKPGDRAVVTSDEAEANLASLLQVTLAPEAIYPWRNAF